MIIRGGQRSNGGQLGAYLLDEIHNDAVHVLEAAFATNSDDIEALQMELQAWERDAFTLAKSDAFKQAFYHAQINPEPPFDKQMSHADWKAAIDMLEAEQGLVGHERVVVLQEKNDRTHAHIVWNRLDQKTGQIKNMGLNYLKNIEAQRKVSQLLEHPITPSKFDGSAEYSRRAPDFDEKQMAERAGQYARDLIREAWEQSDNSWSLRSALEDKGLILCRGRRGVIAIDQAGGSHLLHRRLSKEFPNLRKADVEARTNDFINELPEYEDAITPLAAIEHALRRKAVLDDADLQRIVENRRFETSDIQQLLQEGDLIQLESNGSEASDLYTTRTVRLEEVSILSAAIRADRRATHETSAERVKQLSDAFTLSKEQSDALKHVTKEGSLKIVEGRAGTGKSHMLKAARETWKAEGYEVIGASFTNNVVNDMRETGFEDSRTLHALLNDQQKRREGRTLSDRSIIVVDEAGQLDNALLKRTLALGEQTGAKLVLVGDRRQLESINRGGMFAQISDTIGHAEMREVRRQAQSWDRQAAEAFSNYEFEEGLALYEQHGQIVWQDRLSDAEEALIGQWTNDTEDGLGNRFVFAASNKVTDRLNRSLQQVRQRRGELGEAYETTNRSGEICFFEGDRIQFKTTDKSRGYVRGMLGTIEKIEGDVFSVLTDDDQRIPIDMSSPDRPDLRLGYAGTVYSGQGKTLDETYLLHQRNWRDQSAYVAMTRAKKASHLFVARSNAKDVKELAQWMSQQASRGSSLNYAAVELEEASVSDPNNQKLQQDLNELKRAEFLEAREEFRANGKIFDAEISRIQNAEANEVQKYQELLSARGNHTPEPIEPASPKLTPPGMSKQENKNLAATEINTAAEQHKMAQQETQNAYDAISRMSYYNKASVDFLASHDRLSDADKKKFAHYPEVAEQIDHAKEHLQRLESRPEFRKAEFGSEDTNRLEAVQKRSAEMQKEQEMKFGLDPQYQHSNSSVKKPGFEY